MQRLSNFKIRKKRSLIELSTSCCSKLHSPTHSDLSDVGTTFFNNERSDVHSKINYCLFCGLKNIVKAFARHILLRKLKRMFFIMTNNYFCNTK